MAAESESDPSLPTSLEASPNYPISRSIPDLRINQQNVSAGEDDVKNHTPSETLRNLPNHDRNHQDHSRRHNQYDLERRVTPVLISSERNHLTTQQNSIKVGERVIGRNKLWCNGRCITGPEQKMSIIAILMIVVPCALFNCITLPWYISYQGLKVALPLLFPTILLEFLSLASFFSTVCADPGIIPRERNPLNSYDVNLSSFRDHSPPKHQDVIINGHLFKLKYCSTCNIYRAPRTVHCSVCDNCVEKFDHHCPWVGNCIGKRNYRRFYFFISSTSILIMLVMLASVVKDGIVITRRIASEGSFSAAFTSMWPEAWESVLVAAFTFGIVWFVVGLWAYHTYLIYANQTTYEHIKNYYEGEPNPWDRGGVGNATEILCTRSRPRHFTTKNISVRRQIFEPKDIESNPPIGMERMVYPNATIGGRTMVCGVEICSIQEVSEPSANQQQEGKLEITDQLSNLPSSLK